MFFKRTLTAIIGLGYFFGLVVLSYFYGHYFVDILILSFAFVALYEMFHAFKIAGYQVYKTPLFVIAATAYPGYYLFEIFKGGTGVLGIFIAALFSAAVALTQSTFSKDRTLSDLFATLTILIYPFLFLSSAFIMSSRYFGAYSIVFAVLLPVATDSFAYWFGSIIKGKKLCPEISPKKTISGSISGLLGGALTAVVFFLVFEYFALFPGTGYRPMTDNPVYSSLIYIAIGLLGSAVSQLGDIAASKIKRQIGIKDFGKIFPGHGGVMDRIDSIIFSICFLMICFSIIY